MAWTRPYLAILTSATTPYKEAKGNDAKAKILAATVRYIMAKRPRSISKLFQMFSKSLSACLVFCFNTFS